MKLSYTLNILEGDVETKRQEIKSYFNETFDAYESLFKIVSDDKGYFTKADPLRHPLVFYYGHTATFFVNKLRVAKIIDERVSAEMEAMMAIGVDEMSWDDLNEDNYDWPSIDTVQKYRNAVRKLVNSLIDSSQLSLPIHWNDPFWIIVMGIEHERIHLETSSVLIRQLPIDWVSSQDEWPICQNIDAIAPNNQLINIEDGTVKQGKSEPSKYYGWDNEYGLKITDVAGFGASKFLVSNKEYLEFVEDKGYQTESWWTQEGWDWLKFKKAAHPVFWIESDGEYKYRAISEEISMPWAWPVDVNYLEAKAFCRWLSAKTGKRIRLPTEAEYYRIYDDNYSEDKYISGETKANLSMTQFASSIPVDQNKHNDFYDVMGNVWQWTETPIDGFKGFKVHPSYDDFSVPTFDGKHNLIKGGSWISAGNEIIRDSRYAFRRHFFQHAGFRYVESDSMIDGEYNMYETDSLISQYLEFHYGDEYFNVPNFPKACIEHIVPHLQDVERARALDIGCAVGRSSFELARHFDYVDALDFSTRFILNAVQLKDNGTIRYMIDDEGELTSLKEFDIKDLELGEKAQNIEFTQGDACNLKPKYSNYNLIFAGNLIDRLYDPKAFLKDMIDRLNTGGLLVITSPYTWLEEYTDKENWLGGKKVNGENFTTLDGLHECLDANFELQGQPVDVPFVIRETRRKHQHTVAQLTVWKKI